MARSGSPFAPPSSEDFIGIRPNTASFDQDGGHCLLSQSERGGFVTEAHIGQREIANEAEVPAVL
jgi:hypothetical protein